ncbi:MAG: RluA family pseudouridine synthase [Saprospiraceae bacterium]
MDSISNLIIFHDHHYLLANKPSGMPVQEDKTGDSNLLRMMQAYCKHDLFLCNRIDRPVSGAVLLAKNKESQQHLSKWSYGKDFKKTYLAIVPIVEIPEMGTWTDFLFHDTKFNKSRIEKSALHKDAKKATLHYRIVQTLDQYRLLEITTETGRFHQIRSQLASRNMPIKGDVKYGARRGNKDRSIGLHAWKISWIHHSLNKKMEFEIKLPDQDIWKHFELFDGIKIPS